MTAPWSDLYPLPWEAKKRGHDWQVVAANGLTVVYVDVEWKARLFAAAPELLEAGKEVATSDWDLGAGEGCERLDAAIVKAGPPDRGGA